MTTVQTGGLDAAGAFLTRVTPPGSGYYWVVDGTLRQRIKVTTRTAPQAEDVGATTAPTTWTYGSYLARYDSLRGLVNVSDQGSVILGRTESLWRDGRRVKDWSPTEPA